MLAAGGLNLDHDISNQVAEVRTPEGNEVFSDNGGNALPDDQHHPIQLHFAIN